jgi:hypothetical protein
MSVLTPGITTEPVEGLVFLRIQFFSRSLGEENANWLHPETLHSALLAVLMESTGRSPALSF